MTLPLRWDGGNLLVLDQRLLPDAEEWIRCSSVEEVADAIAEMAVRGAPAIGLAAAYGLALAEDPVSAAAVLAAARPTASNLEWALKRGLEAEHPLEFAQALEREQMEADRALSELGAHFFEPGDRALTHCNTGPLATGGYGSALGVLRAAEVSHVWVGETRPLLQGARLTAWELERFGIPFEVITDSAAGSLMARGLVDRVVVGADRIAANGDVANKIGTYPLAVLAQRHEIPFYVAAPLSTFDPSTPDGASIPIEERSPDEVAEGVPAFNPAFDVTPAELVTAIFTEAGLLEPEVVRAARAMASLGLVQGSEGNVSVRVGPLAVITPADVPYDEMGAADLVTLDQDGGVVTGSGRPSSERAVHLAIYAARDDVRAVVHTHSPAATASVSVAPVAEHAPPGSMELGANVVAALGTQEAVVMAQHGVVAVGASLDEALGVARRLEARALAV